MIKLIVGSPERTTIWWTITFFSFWTSFV